MHAATLMFAETKNCRKASVHTMAPLFPETVISSVRRGICAPGRLSGSNLLSETLPTYISPEQKGTSLELHLLISRNVQFPAWNVRDALKWMSFWSFWLRVKLQTKANVHDRTCVTVTPKCFGDCCELRGAGSHSWITRLSIHHGGPASDQTIV